LTTDGAAWPPRHAAAPEWPRLLRVGVGVRGRGRGRGRDRGRVRARVRVRVSYMRATLEGAKRSSGGSGAKLVRG